MDLGFKGGFEYRRKRIPELPFKIIGAYDNDKKCVETYKQNIGEYAESLDLSEFNPSDLKTADILIGGFPCQDFSRCGPERGLSSKRGNLYLALVKYMAKHQPSVVVAENVQGLENLGGGTVMSTIIEDFEAQGYRVNVWKLFAPDYGVPQTRRRLFLVGIRKDLKGFPDLPEKTHKPNAYRSIKWAIGDLESYIDDSKVWNQSQYFRAKRIKTKSERCWGQGDETSQADKPSYTIRANPHSRVQFHYSLERRLTVRECARIQTFPDKFVFPFSTTVNVSQIGNAVPPILAHEVAKSISLYLESL